MARAKKIIQTGITKEQMETAFSEYATADAQLAKISATIDVQITAIREKYADKIAKLQETKDANFDILQAFAVENKDELFSKRKSMESIHGTLGFRTGTPKLKTLKGFTWGAVTNLLKEFLPGYVRTVEEPAKDKLLADRDNEEVNTLFGKVGISVVQDETFFVEPKKEANE
ncbi:host-nuclease inhibitor Gam family protein [Capnocytophaga canimorsus]|uniref:host-nuclease inhibitor Gam family protein n=1 Tax=Capnocytophaga canimorsus TaxID=28188 RepID=UPI0037D5D13A